MSFVVALYRPHNRFGTTSGQLIAPLNPFYLGGWEHGHRVGVGDVEKATPYGSLAVATRVANMVNGDGTAPFGLTARAVPA